MSEPVIFTIALKQHNFDQHNVNDTAIVGSSQRYVHTFLDGTKFESGVLESIFLACRQKGAGMTIDLDNPEPFIRDTNAEVLNAFPTKKWSSVEEAKTSIGIHNADTSLATKVEYSFLDQSNDCLVCTFICEQGRKQANEQHDLLVNEWVRATGVYHDIANQTDWSKL